MEIVPGEPLRRRS